MTSFLKYTFGLLAATLVAGCAAQQAPIDRVNGVSFVASREPATQAHVNSMLAVNADFAAVMPFGFIREPNDPEIIFDTDRQWFGETRKGAKQYSKLLQENKVRIMIKPQLWIWRGIFTGDLEMQTEEDWVRLEAQYRDFILNYAALAEEVDAEIFCIGTELEEFVAARPEYWDNLIAEIRGIYSGKLTYAANWDEYPRTPFWAKLDYIGLDAYFPLSEARDPDVEELRAGWQRWKTDIKTLSDSIARPVLFTEYGYRSMDYTAEKPWLVDSENQRVNLEAQANAMTALFQEFWSEPWFAGGFVWKWFIHHPMSGGPDNNRFTPQNKPAEGVIRQFYRQAN
ncbi:GTA TIM-barrel-like domain-containing protein [Robiginitalea myxolifaciens]|uniref:GTA TIM-barrel-like domain-containing protein n=1 Tax=Robiginitalea myxolifaciens TaxID=400055 RepID=A0A1I6GAB2_9FLAO|nr:glycoside hydrolase TIM-barrel-like domain-containing protein [Robiginitalea myxolifaciens]SFR39105.1 GTA TIM-barrel-like domain-containing protein [Robiginitalea myxolifaciens]